MSRKKAPQLGIFLGTGKRIRQIRGDLTQTEFGKLFGVKGNTVSRWEDGRLSDDETLKKIADYGEVTVKWLLRGDKPDILEIPETITIESPQSGPLLHEPYLFGGIDIKAMSQILEVVEQLLSQRRKPLKLMKKALLISLLYDEFQKTGQPLNDATLKEFLRRVA
jgi:transcriptional regulator with XRE-family HTH domain